MVSGLDMVTLLPPAHNDRGGPLVAMLAEAARRLDGVACTTSPPVVWLGGCFHGFAAVGLASAVLYEHYVPVPAECLPVAQECESMCNTLGVVLGERLAEKFALDEGATAGAHGDPMLAWMGPDLSGCVDQMLRLGLTIREGCERVAADTTVLPDQRKVAEQAAWSANFVWTQYM